MDDISKMLAAEYDDPAFTPEQSMILAMFLRYYADLESSQRFQIRNKAIKWFKDKPFGNWKERTGFSFPDVCEILEFSDIRVAKIMAEVAVAERLLECRYMEPGIRGGSFRARCYSKGHSTYRLYEC